MNKQRFWHLMEQTHNDDTNVMLANLTQVFSALPTEDAMLFRAYLTAYMEHVNDCIWVDMACKVINGYVSDDTGLYFALWLIAQGEQSLHAALQNPDCLSELACIPFGNAAFEMLMTIGMDEDTNYEAMSSMMASCIEETSTAIVYKNDDKYGGYEDFEEAMEDIPAVLPNLTARAQQEGFDWRNFFG